MPGMVLRRWFEWDVMTHPSPNAWFQELSEQGWTRVPGSPGISTPRGTVIYEFEHPGPGSSVEPDAGALSVRALAVVYVACAVGVVAFVAAVLIVMAIAQS